MRRYVIGTAGHVDHGKTTLVRALTGVDTDRLPEEKRRGNTIELGYAPWSLGDGVELSLIDVPGHRKLVHHMIAGATGMELVLLVVAADEGVMPQTREHVAAAELLGIRRAVVAITKLDRVGRDVAELAGEEARELLAGRFVADVVLCSAKTGEGIAELTAAVRRALPDLAPPESAPRARLSVDRVFSVKGAGTVVTGTLVEGRIAAGAPLTLVGETTRAATSARGLEVHNRAVEVAEAPTRLALNLGGLALDAVSRGDVITDDKAARATRTLDVALRADAPIKDGRAAQVYVGTARAPCRVDLLAPSEAGDAPGPTLARLRLTTPLVAFGGDRFVLRGSSMAGPTGTVIGGGVVLDAHPPPRKPRAPRAAALTALADNRAAEALRALVEEVAPRPLAVASFASRFVVDDKTLRRVADQLVAKREIAAVASRGESGKSKLAGYTTPASLAALAAVARRLVAEHHEKAPLDRGLALETLRQKLGEKAGAEATEEAIRLACERGAKSKIELLVVQGDVVRLASFGGAPLGGAAAGALGLAAGAIAEAALKGVTEHAVLVATGATPKEVKAILAKLVRDGHAFHAGELWFSRQSFDVLRAAVEAHLASAPKLTIAEFKAMSNLGRKQAIVLLEQLDREGVTRREGDDRVRPPR